MESQAITATLSALSQSTRLEIFRALASAAPAGLRPQDLSARLCVPPSTLSAHLATLTQAGLVTFHRSGRSLTYRAEFARLAETLTALVTDCCNGRPELCAPLLSNPGSDHLEKENAHD